MTHSAPQHGAAMPAPPYNAAPPQPVRHANLDTNRSLLKYILLSLITFGIYALFVTARAGEDLNMIATRWDNKRTMNFWLVALLLGPITFGIVTIVWWHGSSNRIGNELQRRGQRRIVSAGDYWLWGVLGALIIVGPFIFIHKWLKAINVLCGDYNVRG